MPRSVEEELVKAKEELKRIEKERPSFQNSSYFGIVDLAGFPKDRYYLYKAHWMPDEHGTYSPPLKSSG